MPDPLAAIAGTATSAAEAVRWACILEATAPKAGNVFPGRDFEDLCYRDFVDAANIAAENLGRSEIAWSQRVFSAVEQTRARTQTNVNLGILLLIGPLMAAEEACPANTQSLDAKDADDRTFAELARDDRLTRWQSAVPNVLEQLDSDDSKRLMAAIVAASPGGMGSAPSMDVHDPAADHGDVVAAMRLAEDRDRIALQYASGFADFFTNVVPLVRSSIEETGDLITGIAFGHLRMLAQSPDTLIARKAGHLVALDVQQRAARIDPCDWQSVKALDSYLRRDGQRLNPGTTADLMAAALFVLLRLARRPCDE